MNNPEYFQLRPIKEYTSPDGEHPKPEHVIVFVPLGGFQSARYYNGSNSWKSIITGDNIFPTHYLEQFDTLDLLMRKHHADDLKAWVEEDNLKDKLQQDKANRLEFKYNQQMLDKPLPINFSGYVLDEEECLRMLIKRHPNVTHYALKQAVTYARNLKDPYSFWEQLDKYVIDIWHSKPL